MTDSLIELIDMMPRELLAEGKRVYPAYLIRFGEVLVTASRQFEVARELTRESPELAEETQAYAKVYRELAPTNPSI